jgi:hypothetical protein
LVAAAGEVLDRNVRLRPSVSSGLSSRKHQLALASGTLPSRLDDLSAELVRYIGLSTPGGTMSADTIEKLITNAIHTAFIKYPEGDGGPNLDYEWIPP